MIREYAINKDRLKKKNSGNFFLVINVPYSFQKDELLVLFCELLTRPSSLDLWLCELVILSVDRVISAY